MVFPVSQHLYSNFAAAPSCQGFESELDAGSIFAGARSSAGGYILAGDRLLPDFQFHFLLSKADSLGNKLWTKVFPTGSSSTAYSVVPTSDGGYVVAGEVLFKPKQNSDAFLIKTDSAGEVAWGKLFFAFDVPMQDGDDAAQYAQQLFDGGFIVTGTSDSKESQRGWLLRTDSKGELIWKKNYYGADQYNSYGWTGGTTNEGGYFIAGTADVEEPLDNGVTKIVTSMWLIKTDGNGNELFNKTIKFDGPSWAFTAKGAKDGGFILCGRLEESKGAITSSLVVRLDKDGDLMWHAKSPTALVLYEYAMCNYVEEMANDDIIAGGGGLSDLEGFQSWVTRYTENGNEVAFKTVGEEASAIAFAGSILDDGGIALFGTSNYGAGLDENIWISKTCDEAFLVY